MGFISLQVLVRPGWLTVPEQIPDTVPPTVTILDGPVEGSLIADDTPTFEFEASEADSTFEYRVDGGAWTSTTSPRTLIALGDGEHTFEVRATDEAGNVSLTPDSRTFTVDTTGPTTTITDGPTEGSTISDQTPTFEFEADDPEATFEYRLDGAGAWLACTSPLTIDLTDDEGGRLFEVRATDALGNVGAPASRSFFYEADVTAPDTWFIGGLADPMNDPTPTVTFDADEAGCTFEMRVDGGSWATVTSPHTITSPLADGEHTVEVRATDPAGNTDPTPASFTFDIDTDPPQTTIDSGPTDPTTDTTPTFEFSSDEAGSSFEVRIDGGSWGGAGSPYTTGELSLGEHTFEARAIDPAGNIDASPASQTFTVEAAAFEPLDLSPHVLLDPDEFGLVADDPIATAVDTSGNSGDFTQATSGKRPALRGGASLLNGHLVVEHDGSNDTFDGPDLSGLTNGHAFIVVKIDTDPPAAGGFTGLWTFGTNLDNTHFPYTDGNIYDGFATTVRKTVGNPGPSLTSWRIYEVRSAAGDWEALLDGISLFSTATNTVGFRAAPKLGSDGGEGVFLDGRWAYFAIFPALTSGEAAAMRSWLQARFGL